MIAELESQRNVKVSEAAAILGICRGKVYQLMDSGELRGVHIGTSRRIPLDVLKAYLRTIRGESDEDAAGAA